MSIDIRPVAVDERRVAVDTLRAALLSGAINDDTFAQSQPSWDGADSIAAWDDGRCVGHVAAFRFDSTVPGGARLATAGVTRVGVLPTDTRRGLLRLMIERLLRDARDRGQPIATLHASETGIYGRFGFGLGTDSCSALITTRSAAPWRGKPTTGSMRLVPYDQVMTTVPALYESCARWRVGTISRPDWWWPWFLDEAARPTKAAFGKGSFVAVHSNTDGDDDGYVFYDVDWNDAFASNPTGSGIVKDLWGASPEVDVELWRYLLAIDLVTTWKAESRPVDEPVRRLMADTRAYETRARFDDQWVRLLDVDAALTARTFGDTTGAAIVEVTDPIFPDNNARWSLSRSGAQQTTAAPDLVVDIATLSSAYLGAVPWTDLLLGAGAAVGADIVERLDALFVTRPMPFCGSGY